MASIRAANRLPDHNIRIGQKLIIPEPASPRRGSATPPREPSPAAVRVDAARTHIVAQGETLAGLAWRYGVPKQSIRAINRLSGSTLHVGQKLLVPGT
jgi:LysM repeat protein